MPVLRRYARRALLRLGLSAAAVSGAFFPGGFLPGPALAAGAPSEPAAPLALARDVVIYSGVANSFQVIIPQYLDQIGVTFSRSRPELATELAQTLAAIRPEFEKKADEMVETAARLYAQRFSQKELEDLATFFKSQTGRKYVASQPILMSDMFVALQGWSQKISVDMMSRVREDMRKKGHEL